MGDAVEWRDRRGKKAGHYRCFRISRARSVPQLRAGSGTPVAEAPLDRSNFAAKLSGAMDGASQLLSPAPPRASQI
jgi:hypothetical protein